MRRIAPISVVFLLLANLAFAVPKPVESDLTYSDKQSATAVEVVYRLYSSHYNKQRLNDELSEEFLEKYLTNLDPSKMFFYQKDVDEFKVHMDRFDDYFREGKLDAAYDIYSVYQVRVISRLEMIIDLLNDTSAEFRFDGQDSIELSRKEAEWIKTIAEADELWHRRLKLALLNLKMAGKTIEEAREQVAKRYQNQLNRVKQEKSEDVFEVALNALTVLYDPHTNYWSPKTTENFNINMSKSLEGIGAVLQSEDELTKVVRLVPGGPAARQGELKSADRIVAVGQGDAGELVDIVGWRLDEVVQLIRGPKDTIVKLEILPAGEVVGGDTTIVKINRGKVRLEDQEAQKAILELPGEDKVYRLGVIQLPDFYIDFEAYGRRDPNFKSSTRDVERLLDELQADNVDGIILDLRNNGGGSLHEATMLTDLFIDRGVVVQIKTPEGRVGRQNQAFRKPKYEGPLIVLVNRLSASASEIFAGAIQDYGRGLILGSRSFGKGTVQSVKELKLGHLKITESKFYRVSGDSTQHRGVVPDIAFPSLVDEEEVGESAYDHALPWDQIHPVPHLIYNDFSSVLPQLEQRHQHRIESDPDFIYLLDSINFSKENQKQKSISLNEDIRNKRKEQLELHGMEIENKRRKAKGLQQYANLESYRKGENSDEDPEQEEADFEPQKIDVDGDTILIESGNILVDFIELKSELISGSRLAKAE